MLWVVQSNLYKETAFQELNRLLDKMDIPKVLVKPLPFSLKLTHADTDLSGQDLDSIEEPYIDNSKNIMVCGAYTMAKIAKDRGWKPGAFINDNFEYEVCIKNWGGENMLNGDSIISTIQNLIIPSGWAKVFARPTEDTKSFAGGIFHKEQFENWMKDILKIEGFSTMNKETRIMVSTLKEIYAEYRLFVVDGRIVTGSLYKLRDQVIYNSLIDESVISFAKEMISQWQPDRAFVIDIAVTPDGNKIIEINNINSSGFYACDLSKFIISIEEMTF